MRSRRELFCQVLRALAGFALAGARGDGASVPEVDRLGATPSAWDSIRTRTYRADVVVALLGVPIFSRRGVGSAAASVRESRVAGSRTTALSFAGGADPARTHGLNYAGSTEEIAVESASRLETAALFGFVTAARSEESFEEARKRVLAADESEHGTFTVVDELHSPSRIRVRKASVAGSIFSCAKLGGLRSAIRERMRNADAAQKEYAGPPDRALPTFLYATLGAIRSAARQCSVVYAHNAKTYELTCEKSAAQTQTLVAGKIRDIETKRRSSFRLWLDPGYDLPSRIEFSPRSYLRITLEHDQAIAAEEAM
jgi:hypothetical protein